jgi:iron complex transport system substrate-binding protein
MPCGWDSARTEAELPILATIPGWHDLTAVRRGQVVAVDGNQLFNRPGPRLVESLAVLCDLFDNARWN